MESVKVEVICSTYTDQNEVRLTAISLQS